jgi:hypothetical protein
MDQAGAQSSGNDTQTFAVGFWGVRYQVNDVATLGRVLYESPRLQTGSTESAGIRSSVNRQLETGSQRARSFRFPSNA